MKKLTSLIISLFLVLAVSASYALEFKGKGFSVELPSKKLVKTTYPLTGHNKDIGGVIRYKGQYQTRDAKINIEYTIEEAILPLSICKPRSNEAIALQLLDAIVNSCMEPIKILAVVKLDPKKCMGAFGMDVYYGTKNKISCVRILSSKPKAWIFNVDGKAKNVDEVQFIMDLVKSFKITKGAGTVI